MFGLTFNSYQMNINSHHKYFFASGLCAFILAFSCCSSKQSDEERLDERTTTPASLWLQFAKGMESKNIEYLMENSLDTIQCADCNLSGNPDNEYYESRFVFEAHLDRLMHLPSLSDRNHTIYQDNGLMHVVYEINAPKAFEGGYNLIFTFIKVDSKYLFEGMIVT